LHGPRRRAHQSTRRPDDNAPKASHGLEGDASNHARSGRRRRIANSGPFGGGKDEVLDKTATLRLGLRQKADQLYKLFSIWDENGDGAIDEHEFRRAIRMLGLRTTEGDFENLCELCDKNGDRRIDLEELTAIIEATEEAQGGEDDGRPRHPLVRLLKGLMWFLSLLPVQTVLYLVFVLIFQTLTESVRMRDEYYLDKLVSDTLLDNTFDENHNTFDDIRRVADVYEWGSAVLWSGLLGNAGPSCGDVGMAGAFRSAEAHAGTYAAGGGFKGGCNDDAWADGDGALHMRASTGWSIEEITARYNQLDWTEGVAIAQTRSAPMPSAECPTSVIGDACYGAVDTRSFGYNWCARAHAPPL
jgi:hypothetical protein